MENEFGGAGNYNQELQTMLQDILTHITGRPVTADGNPTQTDNGSNTEQSRQAQNAESVSSTDGRMPGAIPGMYSEARSADNGPAGEQPGSHDGANAQTGQRRFPGLRTWTSNMGNGQISVSVGNFSPDDVGRHGARRADGTDDSAHDNEHGHQPLFIDPEENAPISLGNLMTSLIGALGGAPRDGAGGLGQMFGVPIGNLGDYAWGQNSFDDIITHIMEQNQGVHAPPPATEDSILNLPRRKIAPEEVDKKFECGICMEEYKAEEEVMTLPCKHVYHLECIDHWLKMNGTCPICRTRTDEDHAPHSAPPAPLAHSDLPGSFPSSPTAQSQGDTRQEAAQNDSASVPPPVPEPMD
ncbi:hypothetical protein IW145_000903 [Coemansia sp. RSA 521]|nr:hypothetical protein GGH17_003708 [Coemansia sp. RSA 788]KAJ2194902.1 hypothetical protein IW144_003731 [Coemansia sp. RSA 522]KAJ2208204.1 hypothetical protein IW145_000903 [Coemansia sp. RSA 521]KAJ2275489.1 hypothetical protein J3F81_001786 [Coemansia sp. RSA 371]KAJ2276500.1 hypothetical protein GGH14_003530 [Coemansia sp. RSA 370]